MSIFYFVFGASVAPQRTNICTFLASEALLVWETEDWRIERVRDFSRYGGKGLNYAGTLFPRNSLRHVFCTIRI